MKRFLSNHLKTYICVHVFEEEHPVLLVINDGDWIMTCGKGHEDSAASYRVVGIGHLLSRDPTLELCADLGVGFEAERISIGEPWIKTKSDS
jgi:hypothetical protein